MKINFYLNKNTPGKLTTVLLYIFYQGERIKVSTGESVLPEYWNRKQQRVRKLEDFTAHIYINDRLEEIELRAREFASRLLDSDQTNYSIEDVKQYLLNNTHLFTSNRTKLTFMDHYQNFVDYKRKHVKDIREYHYTLRKHLNKGKELYGELTYESIKKVDNGFIETLNNYLTYEAVNALGEKGMSVNSIGKINKALKAFLNWSFDSGIYPRFSLKHIISYQEDVDKVYLTEEELNRLEQLDLKGEEEIVRDLFLIGCETGMRFSDFKKVSEDNIQGKRLVFIQGKRKNKLTKKKIIIPISERLRKILSKYDNKPPQYNPNYITKFNNIIREIAEKADIKENTITERLERNRLVRVTTPKYLQITSHTCRRTFCTLKFLAGMPSHAIMKFSGHSSERSFMRYLKLDAEVAAEKYADFF